MLPGSFEYTEAEDDVIRKYADLVNRRFITYGQLAEQVAKVGPVKRDERSVWGRLRRLGLQENLFLSRREKAEANYFRPYLTRAERDRCLALWDGYTVPTCVCCMLDKLIERMEAGTPPSATRNGGKQ